MKLEEQEAFRKNTWPKNWATTEIRTQKWKKSPKILPWK